MKILKQADSWILSKPTVHYQKRNGCTVALFALDGKPLSSKQLKRLKAPEFMYKWKKFEDYVNETLFINQVKFLDETRA